MYAFAAFTVIIAVPARPCELFIDTYSLFLFVCSERKQNEERLMSIDQSKLDI